MAHQLGPWRPRDPNRGVSRVGLFIWLGALAVLGLGIWMLYRLFPGAVSGEGDSARLVYMIAWLTMLSSGLIFARQIDVGQTVRNIALWLGVIAILVVAYMLKDPAQDMLARVQGQLVPGYAVETGTHELTIHADDNGDFNVFGSVNGATVRFMVDTGSSEITLSPDDARRAGIGTKNLAFNSEYETANGTGHGAMVTVDRLAIGPIAFVNVPVSVNKADMRSSLLGMSFLKRMKSFEFSKDKLVLRY